MNDNYEDIIHLPHPEPRHHTRMRPEARAAQFAPFAALTGYDNAIRETDKIHEADFNSDETELPDDFM